MTIENHSASYGQRTASSVPLIEQKRRAQKVSKSIANSAAKAFKETVEKKLKEKA